MGRVIRMPARPKVKPRAQHQPRKFGLALRTWGQIELLWAQGNSALAIAGLTAVRLDRVEQVVRELERAQKASGRQGQGVARQAG